jgi:hypothetical protein
VKCLSVKLVDDGEMFECECGLFEHMGIACCHALKVSEIFYVSSMKMFRVAVL